MGDPLHGNPYNPVVFGRVVPAPAFIVGNDNLTGIAGRRKLSLQGAHSYVGRAGIFDKIAAFAGVIEKYAEHRIVDIINIEGMVVDQL
ncbi:MAG: hypothetical protein JW793_07355 [Acidobacteria bacterium]|nr:hypothetical protein [Acidobacteriota bacterium]